MTLWVCSGTTGSCGTKYAVGLSRCPRCHNTAFYEDGDPMAKITRHAGASDKTLPTPEDPAAAEPDSTPAVAADLPETASAGQRVEIDLSGNGVWLDVTEDLVGPPVPVVEGGEEPSPGSSSSASTEKPQPTSEPNSKPTPSRARKTGSRSGRGQTGSSSAPSTAGGRETGTSASEDTSS